MTKLRSDGDNRSPSPVSTPATCNWKRSTSSLLPLVMDDDVVRVADDPPVAIPRDTGWRVRSGWTGRRPDVWLDFTGQIQQVDRAREEVANRPISMSTMFGLPVPLMKRRSQIVVYLVVLDPRNRAPADDPNSLRSKAGVGCWQICSASNPHQLTTNIQR